MRAKDILELGGTIYPAKNGKPVRPCEMAFQIRNWKKLVNFYDVGVREFVFQPSEIGLIALHLKDFEGKREYINIVETDRNLTDNEKDFSRDAEFFNTSMLTPDNGITLFFKVPENRAFKSCSISPNITTSYNTLVTIPGSHNKKGFYVSTNSKAEIQPLPESIYKLIPKKISTNKDTELKKIFTVLYHKPARPKTLKGFYNCLISEAMQQGIAPKQTRGFIYKHIIKNYQTTLKQGVEI